MALSGSMYTNVGSHWKLSIEWSATQDITNNKSTVTAKMYWENTDDYGAVNSSATKTSAIQHDNGTFSTESASGMADLSANQKKLINTYQFTLTHDSDGTKSFSLDGYFDAQITLGSTYYDRIDLTQTNFTLNTIPRESTLTGGQSWTAGGSTTFTIDRNSSSFTHKIDVYVSSDGTNYDSTPLQTITGIGTSYAWTPTDSDMTAIFDKLNNDTTYWNQPSKIVLTTKDSNDNTVGSPKTYYGTVSSPAANTTASPSSFNVGTSFTVSITRKYSNLISTIKLKNGSTVYKTYTGVGTSLTIDTNALSDDGVNTIATRIYKDVKTDTKKDLTLECTTYYNSSTTDQIVRTATTETVTAVIVNSNPTFTTFDYSDQNTKTSGMTNPYQGTNSPYIIQNQSQLRATILNANKAQGKNYADISKYIATVNGVSKTASSPFSTDIIFDFGVVNAKSNVTLSITVYDSRGNITVVNKVVNIVPYSVPTIVTSAPRTDGFSTEVILSLSGKIEPLNINGTKVNSLVSANTIWRYQPTGGSWSADTAFLGQQLNTTDYTYSTTPVNINSPTGLDNTKSYIIHVKVTDQLSYYETDITVPVGKPIFYIDDILKSLGFNDFPAKANEFRINGTIVFGSTKFASAGGALDMNNSDIVKANGIWFNDDADANGEGFMFAKAGITSGSTTVSDYYNFRINKDGKVLIDGGATRFTSGQPMTIMGGDADMLRIIANDHCYIEFFNDGTGTTRQGWVGYGNPSPNNLLMTLRNEQGDISITPKATANRINLNGDTYISNGVGLTLGTAGSANTANQLTIFNTGDAIFLRSGNSSDAYNAGNIAWQTSGGTIIGRTHIGGTSYSNMTMQFELADETGANLSNVLELNASGANWAKIYGDILPESDNLRQIGNTSLRYQGLYLAGGGGVYWSNDDSLVYDDSTNTFTFKADNGANAIVTCKTLTQTSDALLKTNFRIPEWKALDEINKMDVREYNFITDDTTDYLGVVIGEFDGGDGYVNPLLKFINPDGYATMGLYGLAAMNTLGIQELDARLRKLEGVS